DIAHREHRSAQGRHHVPNLKLRRIEVIPPWHTEIAHDELGEEREIKTEEHEHGRYAASPTVVHHAKHFRPPKMETSHIAEDGGANHDVVEVRNHEIGVVDMHVDADRREEDAGKAADGEDSDESHGVHHGR